MAKKIQYTIMALINTCTVAAWLCHKLKPKSLDMYCILHCDDCGLLILKGVRSYDDGLPNISSLILYQ